MTIVTRKLLIVGAGGHAISVADAAREAGFQVVGFSVTEETPDKATMLGLPVIRGLPRGAQDGQLQFTVAIGDNWVRSRVWQELRDSLGSTISPSIVHPRAIVSASASLAAGCVVLQGAIVGAMADVGFGCIINSAAVIDHEAKMGDFSSVGPGAILGGRVQVGTRAAIGIGATVKHGITVGSDSVVGAASYVHEHVDARTIVFGSPATRRGIRSVGDPYL